MSRFYGSIRGKAESEATRQGTEKTGLQAHIRGWDFGVKVFLEAQGDKDVAEIYLTSGSKDTSPDRLLERFTSEDYDRLGRR